MAGWPEKDYKPPLKPVVVPFSNLSTVLRNGTFESDEDEQKFADFFNKSLFPNVTNSANRQIPKEDTAAPKREDVITKLRYYLKSCENSAQKQVFEKLANLTLAYMTKIAKDGQYHPVVRVNAVLAIGEVNSPKAVEVLLGTVFDPNQFDGARVAALSGLAHLAGQSSMIDPDVGAAGDSADGEVYQQARSQNARADGIHWMRGQAADILAALKSTGPNNDVPPALLTMLNDKDLPIPLRSKAARALGKLKYGDNPPAVGPYLTALVEFMRDALSSDQSADRERVRLIAYDVKEGLQPFASNDQAVTEGLQKALQALTKETENTMTSEELASAIKKAKASLDGLVKNGK